jgi:hypothetical protein
VKISVKDDDVEKTLRKILAILEKINDRHANEALVAAAIRRNTAALSVLTTNPPGTTPKENDMTSQPGQSVADALAQQTEAIANLSSELATEHEQWVAAAQSGDTGQAEAIVAKVQENTDQLNALAEQLRSSNPGQATAGTEGEHPDNTLPNELPGAGEGEPPVINPLGRSTKR